MSLQVLILEQESFVKHPVSLSLGISECSIIFIFISLSLFHILHVLRIVITLLFFDMHF